MPRFPRLVVAGCAHHVIQRGNRRQRVFFDADDRTYFLHLLKKYGQEMGLKHYAYCLMDNHYHLVTVPEETETLAKALGEVHWHYTLRINLRMDWKGSLWQGRFSSYPMDEPYQYRAIRYIELNPVKAEIVKDPGDYPWSSARAHLTGAPNDLLSADRLNYGSWREYLSEGIPRADEKCIRRHARTGRPLGDKKFLAHLERLTGRRLLPKKRGPRPRSLMDR